MKIEDRRKSGLITAGQVYYGKTFEFGGHFYLRLRPESLNFSIRLSTDHVACLNLRSGTVRALHIATQVRPIVTSVIVHGDGEAEKDFANIGSEVRDVCRGADEDDA